MLREENELLTHVGPGTPLGELYRRFWVPALLAEELPERDGPPVRTRILGEDLVGFRDTGGQVGFVARNCPHRGASLFFGRNEEDGLRCVYHGWKFDVTGQCVDMPNEPAESNFKTKIRATSYPARERGGVIWIYMGPQERIPELPELEWARVPADQRDVWRVTNEANWLQMIEGDLDTCHSMFLHSAVDPSALLLTSRRFEQTSDRAPRISLKQTDWGFAYAGRYAALGGRHNWRVTQWLMPCYTLIANRAWPVVGRAVVPADDEHCHFFTIRYSGEGPLDRDRLPNRGAERTVYTMPDGSLIDTYRPLANRSNDYLLDRERQRIKNYTGMFRIFDEDRAMTESMGPIVDRTQEHLGTSDLAVIGLRRRLLSMMKELQQGVEPAAPHDGSVYHVRSYDTVSDEGDFERFLEEHRSGMLAVV
ncbi:MAG: phthalate 4,5-dioxygenase [Chloroflexota bacterium]|jgi:phenylpropionate dioxygenase-like ring-hydroxylating dioxygenase large terminal subunit|nr:phthalate 4,5-dioxygenase [Chloroflexota bacterium]